MQILTQHNDLEITAAESGEMAKTFGDGVIFSMRVRFSGVMCSTAGARALGLRQVAILGGEKKKKKASLPSSGSL